MYKLVIGVDEAGYGPAMGPLVIAATAWRMPVESPIDTLWGLLKPAIQDCAWTKNPSFIAIGDSKKIMVGKLGLEAISTSVRWMISQFHAESQSEKWKSRLHRIAPLDLNRVASLPWYENCLNDSSSFLNEENKWSTLYELANDKIESNKIRLIDTTLRIIDELEFNRLVGESGNKATVLSEMSLQLARQLAAKYANDSDRIEIYCDKQGGRSKYHPLLMHTFDDTWFQTLSETQRLSRYTSLYLEKPIAIQFRVEGDSLLPSAAASLFAKWTREWLIDTMNRYWQTQCQLHRPNFQLKPTAGYYVDAVRFAAEITDVAERIKLPKSSWWRCK